jgi:hypothetical protein
MKTEHGDVVCLIESWNRSLQGGVAEGADVGHHMIRRGDLEQRVGVDGTKEEFIFTGTKDCFELSVWQDLVEDPVSLVVNVLDCHQAARKEKEEKKEIKSADINQRSDQRSYMAPK